MKRTLTIDGKRHDFDLIRADGHALAQSHEHAPIGYGDRGFFVRQDGDLIGLAIYVRPQCWTVHTDILPGCYREPFDVCRTLYEACSKMWVRREKRVRRWRDEQDVADALAATF